MKIVETFTANIYVGLRKQYGEEYTDSEILFDVCRKYCDEVGLGLTITPTVFVYTKGGELGFIVGLINYPRFPSTPGEITAKAVELAELLRKALGQIRVSVVCPNNTYMLEGTEDE